MRISTIVDTNILIDALGPAGSSHRDWSLAALRSAKDDGALAISAIVWAELAAGPMSERDLSLALAYLRMDREDFPFAAAYPAGRAHRLYRERGGVRERTLPDFLIGAHALVGGHRLLTRDASRYRAYFPDLDIVSPEVRP